MDAPPFSGLQLLRNRGAINVYAATDDSGAKVAIKMLCRNGAAGDQIGVERFRREIRLAASLAHPGIAGHRGHGEDWLALEWLDDGLDRPHRQRAYQQPSVLRNLLSGICETLTYLHAKGVVHGDLKPAHIRFRDERPVLIDLGNAAIGSADPLFANELAGSPRWMAPECLHGAQPTPAADIWSLSTIAAWLWTGAQASTDDAETILRLRLEGADVIDTGLAALARDDAGLHAILVAGLGRPDHRPTAARLVHLISRSTAG